MLHYKSIKTHTTYCCQRHHTHQRRPSSSTQFIANRFQTENTLLVIFMQMRLSSKGQIAMSSLRVDEMSAVIELFKWTIEIIGCFGGLWSNTIFFPQNKHTRRLTMRKIPIWFRSLLKWPRPHLLLFLLFVFPHFFLGKMYFCRRKQRDRNMERSIMNNGKKLLRQSTAMASCPCRITAHTRIDRFDDKFGIVCTLAALSRAMITHDRWIELGGRGDKWRQR